MASYNVLIKSSAAKELEDLPLNHRRLATRRIQALRNEPRPHGAEKLSGADLYRVRQGDYRVVYSVSDADREIIVVKIGHRKEVYR